MAVLLNGYVISEVDQIIQDHKTFKRAAEEIGVEQKELIQFRSENKKAFDKLKAQREQGLIITDEPVVKTKKVAKKAAEEPKKTARRKTLTASQIKPVIEPAETDEIKKKAADLELKLTVQSDELKKYRAEKKKAEDALLKANESVEDMAGQIKQLNEQAVKDAEEIKGLKIRIKSTEDKALKMKENTDKVNDRKLKARDEQLEGQKTLLEAAGKDIERQRKTIERLQKERDDIEQSAADTALDYENRLRSYEAEIEELKISMKPVESEEYGPDKAVVDPAASIPSHYAPMNGGSDFITHFENKRSPEEVRGAFIFNVGKYADRLGHKDDEVKEVDKIIDYSQKYRSYLMRGRSY